MRLPATTLLFGLSGLLAACGSKAGTCSKDTDCPGVQVCQAKACVTPGASAADAGGFITTEPGQGEIGAKCAGDGDCGTGMRCLGNNLAKEQKRCSNSCNVPGDCMTLMKMDTIIRLPQNLKGANNAWNSSFLARIVACDDPANHGLGASDGKKYCQFICPENSAAVFNAQGSVGSCHCLPNFVNTAPSGQENCVWDASVECSLFTACKPANASDPACAGQPSCIVNEGLEGTCFDMKTMTQMEACEFAKCGGYPKCDPSCVSSSCQNSDNPSCVDPCCHC